MLRKIYGQDSIKISSAVLLEWSSTVLTIFDSRHHSTLAVHIRVSVSLRVSNEASVADSGDKQLEFRHELTKVRSHVQEYLISTSSRYTVTQCPGRSEGPGGQGPGSDH